MTAKPVKNLLLDLDGFFVHYTDEVWLNIFTPPHYQVAKDLLGKTKIEIAEELKRVFSNTLALIGFTISHFLKKILLTHYIWNTI